MSNGDSGLEFLRFGSSIPGNYWGCCACCIIQNFKVDPDAKGSIQLVSGDGGGALTGSDGALYAGPTYRDIFHQRLRIGTFSTNPMPNHAFIAILSEGQLTSDPGRKWLPILKAQGFEYVRAVNNSVWNVRNHIFMLVRNVGPNAVADQFTPPKAWTDLPSVVPEPWEFIEDRPGLTAKIKAGQKDPYEALPLNKFLSEKDLIAAGAPVVVAGLRSQYHRPQLKASRDAMNPDGSARTNAKPATPSLKTPPPMAM